MNACSIPIHSVMGMSNCWLGFLSWYAVADSSWIPVNFAASEVLCFSPYLNKETVMLIFHAF